MESGKGGVHRPSGSGRNPARLVTDDVWVTPVRFDDGWVSRRKVPRLGIEVNEAGDYFGRVVVARAAWLRGSDRSTGL